MDMDVKQEQDPVGIIEGHIKTEPVNVFDQTEQIKSLHPENTASGNEQIFPKIINQDLENICDVKKTDISYIKQEFSEYIQQKTESELKEMMTSPINVLDQTEQSEYWHPEDTAFRNMEMFPKIIKQELENISDVREADISDIKQEFNKDIQPKTESKVSELLTSHCDLPTLKIESTSDLGHQFSSKSLENTTKVILKKKKRYACPICRTNYSSTSSRSTHIDGHFKKRYIICQYCGKFLKKNDVFQHFFIHIVKSTNKNHIGGKPLTELQQKSIDNVGTCFKDFNDKSKLQEHATKIYKDRKLFKCYICFKRFNRKHTLKRHLITHRSEKPFKCDICFKGFNRKSTLQQHLIIHNNEKLFKCDICSKCFNMKYSLQRHLIIHSGEKPYECNICSKKFSQLYHLRSHLTIHTGEKPFKCDICSKRFYLKYVLQQHLLIHNDEKPFKCDICSKGFTNRFSLRSHFQMHSSEKLFKCDICSKGFNHKSNLRTHLIIHQDKKSFKCDICSKCFDRKSVLQRHLIIHSDEKPFKCNICLKSFTQMSHLRKHSTIHSGEKPFNCDICSKGFNHKCDWNKHLIIHNDEIFQV